VGRASLPTASKAPSFFGEEHRPSEAPLALECMRPLYVWGVAYVPGACGVFGMCFCGVYTGCMWVRVGGVRPYVVCVCEVCIWSYVCMGYLEPIMWRCVWNTCVDHMCEVYMGCTEVYMRWVWGCRGVYGMGSVWTTCICCIWEFGGLRGDEVSCSSLPFPGASSWCCTPVTACWVLCFHFFS
jgi:hypothetical protein